MTMLEKGLGWLYFVGIMGACSLNLDMILSSITLILSPSTLLEMNPWYRVLPVIFLYVCIISLLFLDKVELRFQIVIWLFQGIGWVCVYTYLYFDSASNELASLALVYLPHLLIVIVCFINAWLAYYKLLKAETT